MATAAPIAVSGAKAGFWIRFVAILIDSIIVASSTPPSQPSWVWTRMAAPVSRFSSDLSITFTSGPAPARGQARRLAVSSSTCG